MLTYGGVNVPSSQSADDPGSCDGGMTNRNDVLQFSFEDTVAQLSVLRFVDIFATISMANCWRQRALREYCAPVEVLTRADCDNRICVCECGEDTNFVGVFELCADSHGCWFLAKFVCEVSGCRRGKEEW